MKLKILTLIIFLFIGLNSLNAQETIIPLDSPLPGEISNVPNTKYFKDVKNILGKYLETWLFDDGTYYFKVTFIKKEHQQMGNRPVYYDELACEYLFKVNGQIIYDTYGVNSNIDDNIANEIFGRSIISSNQISLSYSEPATNGSCQRYANGRLLLKYQYDQFMSDPQLIWSRTNNELYGDVSTCPDGTEMDLTEFLIPENMILIKQ